MATCLSSRQLVPAGRKIKIKNDFSALDWNTMKIKIEMQINRKKITQQRKKKKELVAKAILVRTKTENISTRGNQHNIQIGPQLDHPSWLHFLFTSFFSKWVKT